MRGGIIVLLLVLLALSLATHDRRPVALVEDTTLRHAADFPLCVTIKPPPLLRSPGSGADFRLGKPFNDKGAT